MYSAPPPVSDAIIVNMDVIVEAPLPASQPRPELPEVKAVQSGRMAGKLETCGAFPNLLVDEIHCNDLGAVQGDGSLPELLSPPKIGMLHHRHAGPDLLNQVCNLGAFLSNLPAEKRGCHSGSIY